MGVVHGEERAKKKRIGAWCWEERARRQRRILRIETAALGRPMRAQASKRGTHSVYASRRRLRESVPIVWHDRTCKGRRGSRARCAIGSNGKRRTIALNRGRVCRYSSAPGPSLLASLSGNAVSAWVLYLFYPVYDVCRGSVHEGEGNVRDVQIPVAIVAYERGPSLAT